MILSVFQIGDSDYISGVMAVGCARGRGKLPVRVNLPPIPANSPIHIQDKLSERTYLLHDDDDDEEEEQQEKTNEKNKAKSVENNIVYPKNFIIYNRDYESKFRKHMKKVENAKRGISSENMISYENKRNENLSKNNFEYYELPNKFNVEDETKIENYSEYDINKIKDLEELLRTVRSANEFKEYHQFTEFETYDDIDFNENNGNYFFFQNLDNKKVMNFFAT